jgi:hypothetical protein
MVALLETKIPMVLYETRNYALGEQQGEDNLLGVFCLPNLKA